MSLIQKRVSENAATTELAAVSGAVITIALLSQLIISFKPVPLTGQTLGILLSAGILGKKKGMLAVLTYILLGTAGMPFFAGGNFGLARLAGPTGGYLAGFIAAALLVGTLSDRGYLKTFKSSVFSMAAGNILIYSLGVLWLSKFTGWENVLGAGVIPFLPGDILKIIIAASVIPSASKMFR